MCFIAYELNLSSVKGSVCYCLFQKLHSFALRILKKKKVLEFIISSSLNAWDKRKENCMHCNCGKSWHNRLPFTPVYFFQSCFSELEQISTVNAGYLGINVHKWPNIGFLSCFVWWQLTVLPMANGSSHFHLCARLHSHCGHNSSTLPSG